MLGYASCDVYVMETWNTPGRKNDNAQSCYSDKIATGRSFLVQVSKLKTKESFNGLFLKICDQCFILVCQSVIFGSLTLRKTSTLNFGVKFDFSKNRMEPVMHDFLATTENRKREQSSNKRGKVAR